jgi:hypothetical protein
MDFKMKSELEKYIKMGIPEDLAMITVCRKYNKMELVKDLLTEVMEEQNALAEILNEFRLISEQ